MPVRTKETIVIAHLPINSYFLTDKTEILDEIHAITNGKFSRDLSYASFTRNSLSLVIFNVAGNEPFIKKTDNYIDYLLPEDSIKSKRIFNMWNSGNPIKILPPILKWDLIENFFSIVDGYHRARLFACAFSNEELEGEVLFIIDKNNYSSIPNEVKSKLQLLL